MMSFLNQIRWRRSGLDLSSLSKEHLDVLMPYIREFKFPTRRILTTTGHRLPVAVSDLSRFARHMDLNGHGHAHENGAHAHLLGEPDSFERARAESRTSGSKIARLAPLGLYWLPTPDFPAGRVEVGLHAMSDPDLAGEVLIAEIAHGIDYGAMTASQRARINRLFEHEGHTHAEDTRQEIGPDEWFEGHEGGYWSWPGERWMALCMAAYSPSLPRPLEARQPWTHSFDESDVQAVRRILRRPSS